MLEGNSNIKNNNDDALYSKIDIESLWKSVSGFAIVEEADMYLEKVEEEIEKVEDQGTVIFYGKSPIWLYCIITNYVQHIRPDITLYYSKPTDKGYRRYKIYPRR